MVIVGMSGHLRIPYNRYQECPNIPTVASFSGLVFLAFPRARRVREPRSPKRDFRAFVGLPSGGDNTIITITNIQSIVSSLFLRDPPRTQTPATARARLPSSRPWLWIGRDWTCGKGKSLIKKTPCKRKSRRLSRELSEGSKGAAGCHRVGSRGATVTENLRRRDAARPGRRRREPDLEKNILLFAFSKKYSNSDHKTVRRLDAECPGRRRREPDLRGGAPLPRGRPRGQERRGGGGQGETKCMCACIYIYIYIYITVYTYLHM